MIELENRTRDRLMFTGTKEVTVGKLKRVVMDRTKTITLGDARDKDLPPGVVRDERKAPSPVKLVSPEQLAGLSEASRKALDALIAKGDVTRRQLAA